PDAAASPSPAGRAESGAREQLRLLQALPRPLLQRLGRGGRPDAQGAVGHNKGRWLGAQYQRGAGLYFLYAAAISDRAAGEDAWRAFDLAFSHEDTGGAFGFTNRSGTPGAARDACSDAAFFLAQFDQAALVARVSPLADTFRARVDASLPRVRAAGSFVQGCRSLLLARDEHATNRLFVDGLALALTGLLAGDGALVMAGQSLIDGALRSQRADGTFDEAGGEDTSYHNVAILMMQVYALYAGPSPALDEALAKAVRWALPHVGDAGEIDVAGNSRTGSGQETYFGQAKDVNYGESALALAYFGLAHSDPGALAAGERAFAFRYGDKAKPESRRGDAGEGPEQAE
ncbi:MAG: hypothetical protein ACRENE_08730, partial [Polyangiaceae bacterium]